MNEELGDQLELGEELLDAARWRAVARWMLGHSGAARSRPTAGDTVVRILIERAMADWGE